MTEDQALHTRYSPLFLISTVVAVVVGLAVSIHLTLPDFEGMSTFQELAIETSLLATGTATALWLAVIKPLRGIARAERQATRNAKNSFASTAVARSSRPNYTARWRWRATSRRRTGRLPGHSE